MVGPGSAGEVTKKFHIHEKLETPKKNEIPSDHEVAKIAKSILKEEALNKKGAKRKNVHAISEHPSLSSERPSKVSRTSKSTNDVAESIFTPKEEIVPTSTDETLQLHTIDLSRVKSVVKPEQKSVQKQRRTVKVVSKIAQEKISTSYLTPKKTTSSITSSQDEMLSPYSQIAQENPTPLKTYKFDPNCSVKLTPTTKKVKRVIYMIRRKSDGKSYIGKTETTLSKRISAYHTSFNKPESTKGQMPLPKAVRENPENFEFGVLYVAKEGEDLPRLETAFINIQKEKRPLFNQRSGGGGGRSRKKPVNSDLIKKMTGEIISKFVSPKKKPIVTTEKGQRVLFSPEDKKAKGVIYVFKNMQNGERYIGKTIREINKRISEHLHYARHPEKDAGKAPLQQAIRLDASKIEVGILYHVKEDQMDHIDSIEKAFIEYYQSHKTGYNQNAGGGIG